MKNAGLGSTHAFAIVGHGPSRDVEKGDLALQLLNVTVTEVAYVYEYIYIYVNICVYVYIFMYIFTYIFIYIFIYIFDMTEVAYVYTYKYMCIFV